MAKRAPIGLAGVLLLLSGCDAIYGVQSHADLKTMPDLGCVDATLRHLPGITVSNRERNLWTYKANGIAAQLQIAETPQEIEYRNSDQWMGHRVPAAQMDAIEPAIKAVDKMVFSTCHLQAQAPLVHERTP